MIGQIDSVKKVGLFEDYSHPAGCEFGDVTILYGENGVGKSTIAAILDSLRERNGAEILRRLEVCQEMSLQRQLLPLVASATHLTAEIGMTSPHMTPFMYSSRVL